MDREEKRLECLRLAATTATGGDVLVLAQTYWSFMKGEFHLEHLSPQQQLSDTPSGRLS